MSPREFHRRRGALSSELNWRDIPCVVYAAESDIAADLVMIDENLMRHELSPAERAQHVARRKALYEALHPETANGASQAAGMNRAVGRHRQNGDDVQRFTKATALATGASERTIQREAERGERLADVIPRIRGTSLDAPGEMDALMRHVARREALYEALHPETAHGGDRRSSRQIGDLIYAKTRRAPPEASYADRRANPLDWDAKRAYRRPAATMAALG